jgi:hypothetical protein
MILIQFIVSILLISNFAAGSEKVKRTATGNKWPDNEIPYEISGKYAASDQEFIEKTIRIFESSLSLDDKKCLKFVPRTTQKSYIHFVDSDRCSSHVGFSVGMNEIKLSKAGCIRKGIILHEIMHRFVKKLIF